MCRPRGGLGWGKQKLQESDLSQGATAHSARSLLGIQKGRALWAVALKGCSPQEEPLSAAPHLDCSACTRAAKVALPSEASEPHGE